VLALDLDRRTFRLHDTIRHFLRGQIGKGGLVAQNKSLLRALDRIEAAPQAEFDILTRRYFFLNLPNHLAGAEERERLDKLLLDPSWLTTKLSATGSPHALVADYDQHGIGELQNFIGRTLRLTTGICTRHQRQLIPQLLGRIMGCKAIGATGFLQAARCLLSPPAILTQRLSLTPPGAETARLEGHSDSVYALCVLPDGRLASGSSDNTIRLWDLNTGAETARLEAHSGSVSALCVLPDGRLASASDDKTIRLWDLNTGAETARLEGHSNSVKALCVLPDGRLASASDDKTIRLRDLNTGAGTGRFVGWVKALCVLPDGRLASASGDKTIRLWDLNTGAETARLEGPSNSVGALCVLPDGRLASASDDKTVRLWDLNTGAETARLEFDAPIYCVTALPDASLVAGDSLGRLHWLEVVD
jgi:WD40 repeat protein